MDILEVLSSVVSAIAAAVAAVFAYKAIGESRRNLFIKDKHLLAAVLRDIKNHFTTKGPQFKISEYSDYQRVVLNSEFFISKEFFKELNVLLSRLHKFEASDTRTKIDDSKALLEMIDELQCKTRLD